MRSTIIVFFSLLVFSTTFITHSANAENVVEINLRSAVELALKNNLNLQLRQVDVDSAEGATQAEEGVFDIFIDAEANVQSEERTPLFFAGAEHKTPGSGTLKRPNCLLQVLQ